MSEELELLRQENQRLRRILRDTLDAVRSMGGEDEEPPCQGWSSSIQGIQMCEVPDLLGETPGQRAPRTWRPKADGGALGDFDSRGLGLRHA